MINLSGVKAFLLGGFFLLGSVLTIVFLPPNTEFSHDIFDLEILEQRKASEVIKDLEADQAIHNQVTFRIAAWILGYYEQVTAPGLYQLKERWNNWQLIGHLKSTPPTSVAVVIVPYQMRRNTIKNLCANLDIKYTALRDLLHDPHYLKSWGPFNKESIYCLLFADTLLIHKDSRAKEVADRLFRNYLDYWSPPKLERAASLGLTPQEVGILASIVYAETKIGEEMPVIAGLYLNRLQQDMRLQADPTVVYAAGRPLNRVLKAHKRIRSDYNTYRVEGLPPGPVFTPTQEALEAVLNAGDHDYLYFCARHDFSGYHHFSRTLDEHQKAAKQYQRELNKRKIGFRGP
ncbi:MAG: endolytic transglycosylase MltG [Cyclobacteriaceae bacterium]|nr:endolytic transglycosylase MltG [Cyclobacteriaceae bacterium]